MRLLNKIVLPLLLIGGQSISLFAWAQNSVTEQNVKGEKIVYLIPKGIIDQHSFEAVQMKQSVAETPVMSRDSSIDQMSTNKSCNLLHPDKIVSLNTPLGNITISPGAIVLITQSDTDLVIYDLYQTKNKQVIITVNNHQLVMKPGLMLVLSKKDIHKFEQLNVPCRQIACCEKSELSWSNKEIKALVAEFSICSAFITAEPLKKLMASKDRQDQLISQKLLKTAAILEDSFDNILLTQLSQTNKQNNSSPAI